MGVRTHLRFLWKWEEKRKSQPWGSGTHTPEPVRKKKDTRVLFYETDNLVFVRECGFYWFMRVTL